ncbi:hypothetical protein ACVI1J_003089 [Bradyrhizobium diazoefficiens]
MALLEIRDLHARVEGLEIIQSYGGIWVMTV